MSCSYPDLLLTWVPKSPCLVLDCSRSSPSLVLVWSDFDQVWFKSCHGPVLVWPWSKPALVLVLPEFGLFLIMVHPSLGQVRSRHGPGLDLVWIRFFFPSGHILHLVCPRSSPGPVLIWSRSCPGLVQVWSRSDPGIVQHFFSLVQVLFWSTPSLVWVRPRSGPGLSLIWSKSGPEYWFWYRCFPLSKATSEEPFCSTFLYV